VLIATATALFLVALFALLRPTLLLKVAVPQQNFVAILLDDSSSMRVADENGGPRRAFVEDQLGRPDGPLLTALGKRFVPRVFRFSTSAERLQSTADLTFRRHRHPHGRRAQSRPRRAERPAGRRAWSSSATAPTTPKRRWTKPSPGSKLRGCRCSRSASARNG
jgi:hypothetical protein